MEYTYFFTDGASICGHVFTDKLDEEARKYCKTNQGVFIKAKLPGLGPGERGRIYKPNRIRDGWQPHFNHTVGVWVETKQQARELAKRYGLEEKGSVTAEEHQAELNQKRRDERGNVWTNDEMLKKMHDASGIEIEGNFAAKLQEDESNDKLSEGVYMEEQEGATVEKPVTETGLDRKDQIID